MRELGEVTAVVDGDTLKVRINGTVFTVRYIGIDTPETKHPTKGIECFGPEASVYNSEQVGNRTVGLEKDVTNTDRYGRLLRYVWMGERLINEELVLEGYAAAKAYPPDTRYQERFEKAQERAETNGKGRWSACPK